MSLTITNMLKISINIYYTIPWWGGGYLSKGHLGPPNIELLEKTPPNLREDGNVISS